MTYCTPKDVRDLANISTDDMTDSVLLQIINAAQTILNRAINSYIYRENMTYIDEHHQNTIDGSNKTFYLRKPQEGWYVGDSTNSGDITTDDVKIEEWKSDETIYAHNITTIDYNTGKVVLEVAPETGSTSLLASYAYVPVDVSTPDNLVKWACAHLAASMAYTKLDSDDFKKISLRTLEVTMQPKPFSIHYNEYKRYLQLISDKMPRIGGRSNMRR